MKRSEVLELAQRLSKYDCFFRELFDIGKIHFTDRFPTACVEFDRKTDEAYQILINEKFWRELNDAEQEFLICHELSHIIFNHKKRFRNFAKNKLDPTIWNKGIDVAVNEMLVDNFKFNRNSLVHPILTGGCFVDTVFPDGSIKSGLSSDYYVDELLRRSKEQPPQGGGGEGKPQKGQGGGQLIDDHSSLNDASDDSGDGGDEDGDNAHDILDELTEKGRKDFFKKLNKDQKKDLKAGKESVDGGWEDVDKRFVTKRKWETIIRHYTKKALKENFTFEERWDFPSSRYSDVAEQMGALLPFERGVIGDAKEKCKIDVMFFLDVSGSCAGLGPRFFAAAKSIPFDRFNVNLAFFDTGVTPVSIKDTKVKMGGGTCFRILEEYVKKLDKYPDLIWVLTDGYGTPFTPEHAKRWHFFLTEQNTESYIPKGCKIHKLANFE